MDSSPNPVKAATNRGRAGPKRRERQTCAQCRLRRTQCSRTDPCEACRLRNDQCDWSGGRPAIPAAQSIVRNRASNDTEAISTRVEALIALCERMTNAGGPPQSYAPAVTPRGTRAASAMPSSVPVDGVTDIVTELSSMTLNQAVQELRTPAAPSLHRQPLFHDAKYQVEDAEKQFFATTGPFGPSQFGHSEGILGLGEGPSNVTNLLSYLPAAEQLPALLEQHDRYLTWMHRIHHLPSLYAQVAGFSRLPRDEDYVADRAGRRKLHWLAIMFAIVGLVMYGNNDFTEEECRKWMFPASKEEQKTCGRMWLRCATSALKLGKFMDEPSLDAIRAMATLAQFPLYTSNGENLGAAVSFVSLGLNLARQIQLHIDPDDLEEFKNATDLVKQDRRRVMAALLCADWKMGGLICKRWALEHPSRYKVKLPFDRNDRDFDMATGALAPLPPLGPGQVRPQTVFTALNARLKVSEVWQEIGIAFKDPEKPPTHDRIMQLDAQLNTAEAAFPPCIKTEFLYSKDGGAGRFEPPPEAGDPILATDRLATYAVVAGAHIRLHRGFLTPRDGVPAEDLALHRERVLHYGRMMLALERTRFYPLRCVPLQFFILSAAIALAVYCLTAEEIGPVCDSVRLEVHYIRSFIREYIASSSILRRSHAVLGFLLERDTQRAEEMRARLSAKRARRSDERPAGSAREAARTAAAFRPNCEGWGARGAGDYHLPHRSRPGWPTEPNNAADADIAAGPRRIVSPPQLSPFGRIITE